MVLVKLMIFFQSYKKPLNVTRASETICVLYKKSVTFQVIIDILRVNLYSMKILHC